MLEHIKAQASALRSAARLSGQSMQHTAALEQVAKAYGYANWRACRAALTESPSIELPQLVPATPDVAWRRFESQEAGLALDVPSAWKEFPPMRANSPFEVARFMLRTGGEHLIIIFRKPRGPGESTQRYTDDIQAGLETIDFFDFSRNEVQIGPHRVSFLDSGRVQENGFWRCRHYMWTTDAAFFVIGVGSTNMDAMLGLYDRIAHSFSIGDMT